MVKRPGTKIKLTTIDELLGVPDGETSVDIPLEAIQSFQNHPFKVIDDEKMEELVTSIQKNGILTPVLVRPKGKGYEMISGHRRMHGARLAGLETIPAIVRELSDDDATIAMVDANLQREEILPSEKAFAYKMRLEAMKHKVGRPSKDDEKNSSQKETNLRSDKKLANEVKESRAQIHRYIRLTELIPEILEMVDVKRMPLATGVDVSYIDATIQKFIYEYIRENGMVKSYQIIALRKYLEENDTITQAKMIKLLNDNLPGRLPSKKVTLTEKKLKQYFSANYSSADMEKIIIRLLEQWKEQQGS